MAGNVAPNIVDNGLVLYLDAANIKSYPTTGTTWTDLSKFNNGGALTNGPTFNTNNGGSIVFDGTNDYVDIGSNIQNYSSFTTSIWVNYLVFDSVGSTGWRSPLGDDSQSFSYHILFLQGIIYLGVSSGFIGNPYVGVTHNIVNVNNWYNFVITKNSSDSVSFYQNGVLLGTQIKSGNVNVNKIGKGYVYDNVRCSNFSFYNRALTQEEILQNYNIIKNRYL